jgi:hypothetical protein
MFGFPPILNGNAGIKFTRDADSGFPKPGIREIFYSIKDGNWTDRTVWETASGRVGLLPTANDDVYVRHTISTPSAGGGWSGFIINNLFISGRLNIGSFNTNQVFNIQSTGILDVSVTNISFNISGDNNRIDNLSALGNSMTFGYNGLRNQTIMNLPYRNLTITGSEIKTPVSDLNLLGNLSVAAQSRNTNLTFDLLFYNLTISGTTTIGGSLETTQRTFFLKSGTGNILFIGQLTASVSQGITVFDLSGGNPNVECRGGILSSAMFNTFRTGTGTWTLTGNQTVTGNFGGMSFDCPIIINTGTTVTFTQLNNSVVQLNNTINGTDGTSLLLMGTNGVLTFATAASVPSMTTGTWDFTTNANTIRYTGNYSATIPSYFTNFHSLTISGTGTKTLGVNTTLNGNLSVASGGTFDLAAFNIDVIGQTTIATQSVAGTATLSKSGAGNVLFRGLLLLSNSASPKLNFSGGNPTVELRGGIQYGNGADPINSGTGQWSFTTNNQNIRHISGLGPTVTFNCPILIASGITLTVTSTTPFSSIAQFNNSVNGASVTSILVSSNNTLYIGNVSFPQPMTTGIFDITTNANTLGYVFNGNYTLPYTAFSGLLISGTGTKTLSGNTTISGALSVTAGATLEMSTFNLTITGTAQTTGNGTISKNGSGNIIFTGQLNANINFTGNPSVELRGGWTFLNHTINTGTGTFSFTTANQTLSNPTGGIYTPTFNCGILISGVTLTYASTIAQTLILTGVLNGSSGGSTFRMGTGTVTLNYQNTTQPMATGVLDTSTNLNTFIYGAGNQDVKGGVTPQQYRNLRFSGSGTTKTLQGNINVQNTYTVDAGVTVNLNGFIKTP